MTTNYQQMIKPTSKGGNAHRGIVHVYAGEVGKPLNPTRLDHWHKLGRPTNIPEFGKSSNPLQITAGLPKGLLLSIPQEEVKELTFSFDIFTLQAMQLSLATDTKIVANYASDGQTTVASGGTKTSATLTSATGIAKGDMVIVDLSHSTYGGFPEFTVITKVTGDVVEYEPLPIAPANSATFKKVAGTGTGTDDTDTGLYIPDTLTEVYPRVQLLVVVDMPNLKGTYHHWIKEGEVISGTQANFNDPLATVSFTVNPIIQDAETFDLVDGTTAERAWYMKSFLIPNES